MMRMLAKSNAVTRYASIFPFHVVFTFEVVVLRFEFIACIVAKVAFVFKGDAMSVVGEVRKVVAGSCGGVDESSTIKVLLLVANAT